MFRPSTLLICVSLSQSNLSYSTSRSNHMDMVKHITRVYYQQLKLPLRAHPVKSSSPPSVLADSFDTSGRLFTDSEIFH